MSDVRDNANYVIVLSTVDRIHEVLVAFLRTSEFRIWSLDESASNDSFVITCIHGDWKKSLLGLGSTLVPGNNARRTLAQILMRLQVTIRPSPRDLTIGINYQVFHHLWSKNR